MTFTISLGWWLLPLAITIIAFGGAAWLAADVRPTAWLDLSALAVAVYYGIATIVSLVAWLIWEVLT